VQLAEQEAVEVVAEVVDVVVVVQVAVVDVKSADMSVFSSRFK